MNRINAITLATITAVYFTSCDRPKAPNESKSKGPHDREQSTAPLTEQHSNKNQQLGNSEDTNNWAMNMNAEMHNFYSQPPPPWLKIGKAVTTRIASDTTSIQWTRKIGTTMQEVFSEKKKVYSIASGKVNLPKSLSGISLTSAMVNDRYSRALICKSGYQLSADVYDIKEGLVIEESRQEVPVINFDDQRRWHISWKSWISDSMIVGIMDEPDLRGEGPVREAIYLYDTNKRELQHVKMPDGATFKAGNVMAILAVAPDFLLMEMNGKAQVIQIGE